ncbi:DUF937 domain-containing protein [Neolewinella antarctica]|uniref:DUF937 domain-containing protein n=1 Tax=Neolewinella antarctica TaxID=442734 RepID=A0ABX0X879_9BACT|nr:DUF937 domain-containing protein [Neolewinella antarctica]NJC25449.1 hypothetical protein [Neolewinella antarctica]
MLDSIMGAVKGQITSAITEKTGLDLGQAQQAIPLAQDSVTEGLTGAVTSGNVDGILGMLKSATGGGGGDLVNNLVYKGIAGSFVSKLTSSLGLSSGIASTIAGVALPMIMSKLGGATQQAGDSDGLDAGSLMGVLGMDTGGLLGQAGKLLGGGDKGGGGGLLGGLGGLLK